MRQNRSAGPACWWLDGPVFVCALAQHWIEEGVVASVEASKRKDANEIFGIATADFSELDYNSSPDVLHG